MSVKDRMIMADLIYLPPGLVERCSNCTFIKGNFCNHPKLQFDIEEPKNECCGFWNNPKIDRSKTQK